MFKQSRPKGAPCEREGAPVGAPGCGPRGVWWTDRGRGVRAGAAAEPAAALLVAGTYEKAICGWERKNSPTAGSSVKPLTPLPVVYTSMVEEP